MESHNFDSCRDSLRNKLLIRLVLSLLKEHTDTVKGIFDTIKEVRRFVPAPRQVLLRLTWKSRLVLERLCYARLLRD